MEFILRERDGTHTVVTLKYAALFYWLMWPTVVLTVLAEAIESPIVRAIAGVAWILFIASAVPYWPIVFKLRRIMKEREITAKGSKYSFENPLTYEWED